MKILLCHSNPKAMAQLMESPLAAGNLVIQCLHGRDLIPTLAATEPHLVVIGGDKLGSSPEEIETGLRMAGFRTRTIVLRDNSQKDGFQDVWRSLLSSPCASMPVEYDLQNYIVLAEKSIGDRDEFDPPSGDALEKQENRLLALLGAGATLHAQADLYLKTAIETERNYQGEWALGVLTGDAKAYLWRAQLFRYVSALAHYVPGVDASCLPLPNPPSTKMDFLPVALSGEAFYALNAVRAFGMNRKVENGLWKVGQFETTQYPRLAEDISRLSGWASIVREAAISHVQVLGACLAKNPARLAELDENRHTRIGQKIFAEFWGLKDALGSSGALHRLAKEFHNGRRAVGIRGFCSFSEFVDRTQQEAQVHLSRN